MKLRILSDTEKKLYGADIAVTTDSTDLVALATGTNTGTLTLAPYNTTVNGTTNKYPAETRLQLRHVRVNTEYVFSDSGNACAVTLGDTGSANRYLASFSVISGAGSVCSAGTGTPFSLTSADTLKLAFTGQAGKDLDTATAGSLTFFISTELMASLPSP